MYRSHSWKSSNCFLFMSRMSDIVPCVMEILVCGVNQNILLYLISQQGKLAGIVGIIVIQDLGLPGACDRELCLLHSQRAGPLTGCGGDSDSGRWRPRQESRGDGVGADSSGRGPGGTVGISTSAWRLENKWRIWDVKVKWSFQPVYSRFVEDFPAKRRDNCHIHTRVIMVWCKTIISKD